VCLFVVDCQISDKTMDTTIESLERYYKSIISQDGCWRFFLCITDYVFFVMKTKETLKLIREKTLFIGSQEAWDKLCMAYTVVKDIEKQGEVTELKKFGKNIELARELLEMKFSKLSIKEFDDFNKMKNHIFSYFDIHQFKNYTTRIHNYLMDNLDKKNSVTAPENGQLITRDSKTGNFYCQNKLIEFKNTKSIYYFLFECLYEKSQINGFCDYETMNKYLEERGEEKYEDRKKKIDRIKNGMQNLFRFSNLKNETPTGKKLIMPVRGKGWILNK